MQGPAKTKGNQPFPNDKYGTKYPDTPPLGGYDIEAADALTRPKSPAVVIREPLNLYKKPASIRPEPNDKWMPSFGSDVKLHIDLGPGFTPIKEARKKSKGTMRPKSGTNQMSFGAGNSPVKATPFKQVPTIEEAKSMSREQKF